MEKFNSISLPEMNFFWQRFYNRTERILNYYNIGTLVVYGNGSEIEQSVETAGEVPSDGQRIMKLKIFSEHQLDRDELALFGKEIPRPIALGKNTVGIWLIGKIRLSTAIDLSEAVAFLWLLVKEKVDVPLIQERPNFWHLVYEDTCRKKQKYLPENAWVEKIATMLVL